MSAKTKPETLNDQVLEELRAIRRALSAQTAAVLGRDEAAAYISVSTATLDRLTSAGKLRSVRVSEGRVGWTRKGLDAYLEAQEQGT
jgi:excisionase family DNA binding protein